MKIELEITADEAQCVIDYLTQNKEVNNVTDCLHRVINALYATMCKQEMENESFREVIEGFLMHDNYPSSPDPEIDPFLFDDEENLFDAEEDNE